MSTITIKELEQRVKALEAALGAASQPQKINVMTYIKALKEVRDELGEQWDEDLDEANDVEGSLREYVEAYQPNATFDDVKAVLRLMNAIAYWRDEMPGVDQIRATVGDFSALGLDWKAPEFDFYCRYGRKDEVGFWNLDAYATPHAAEAEGAIYVTSHALILDSAIRDVANCAALVWGTDNDIKLGVCQR